PRVDPGRNAWATRAGGKLEIPARGQPSTAEPHRPAMQSSQCEEASRGSRSPSQPGTRSTTSARVPKIGVYSGSKDRALTMSRIRQVIVRNRILDPASSELWVTVRVDRRTPTTEVRGRLTGPRCPYATTVEVAYPLRPLP